MKQQLLENKIRQGALQAVEAMEQPDYPFPTQLGRSDWRLIVGLLAVCALLIILCMTGVIH